MRRADARRKKLKRQDQFLTERMKKEIREGNKLRKQKQREKESVNRKRTLEVERKLEEENRAGEKEGGELVRKWRNKYYKYTNVLKVKVSELTKKHFSKTIGNSSSDSNDFVYGSERDSSDGNSSRSWKYIY